MCPIIILFREGCGQCWDTKVLPPKETFAPPLFVESANPSNKGKGRLAKKLKRSLSENNISFISGARAAWMSPNVSLILNNAQLIFRTSDLMPDGATDA